MIVELEQIKSELLGYEQTMHEVESSLDISNKEKKIEELEREMEAPDFWNEPDKANAKISLSEMTFSHQMVRLVFVEQLYRAFTILKGESYHHD